MQVDRKSVALLSPLLSTDLFRVSDARLTGLTSAAACNEYVRVLRRPPRARLIN